MEDVVTEIPPPSRFFQDDLNNFASPLPSLPSPFILFSNPKPVGPIRPSILVIAISSSSQYVLHQVSSKTLIGSLILPEIPFAGNLVEPSLGDKSCNIYSLKDDGGDNSVIVVSVQYTVAAERSHAVARLLIGEQIIPEKVLILDSIQSRNFRGKLSRDDTYAFKLETSVEKKSPRDELLLKDLDYFPSGSVVDGFPAALLSRCQMRKIKGSLCLSWPVFGSSVISLIKSLLLKDVLLQFDLSLNADQGDELLKFGRIKEHPFDSDLYT